MQEANITYPRDTALMLKLAAIAHKVGAYLNKHLFADPLWQVDLKAIKSIARHCFYDKEKPLVDLWALAYQEVTRIKRGDHSKVGGHEVLIRFPGFYRWLMGEYSKF